MFAAVRIQLYNPNDPHEVALVNALQDQFVITAKNALPLPPFNWDTASLDALRAKYEAEAAKIPNFNGMMGPRGKVNEATRHIAAAAAWGLFPDRDAMYLNYFGSHGTDHCFKATYKVPENGAFWSITMYGATGFIESRKQHRQQFERRPQRRRHLHHLLRAKGKVRRRSKQARHPRGLELYDAHLFAGSVGPRWQLRLAPGRASELRRPKHTPAQKPASEGSEAS